MADVLKPLPALVTDTYANKAPRIIDNQTKPRTLNLEVEDS